MKVGIRRFQIEKEGRSFAVEVKIHVLRKKSIWNPAYKDGIQKSFPASRSPNFKLATFPVDFFHKSRDFGASIEFSMVAWLGRIGGRLHHVSQLSSRAFTASAAIMSKGLVLGAFNSKDGTDVNLTASARNFDSQHGDKVLKTFKSAGLKLKSGQCRVFHGLDETFTSVALVGLGDKDATFCWNEERDLKRENIRVGVAAGVKALRDTVKEIHVDGCGDPEAAGEGARLCLHVFDELKREEKRKPNVDLALYQHDQTTQDVLTSFEAGVALARGQNVARRLMELPANHCTPTLFVREVEKLLGSAPACQLIARDRPWMEEHKMYSFLSVTNGSAEPPKFLEIIYKHKSQQEKPFALVGKGVTFDSGGISLKPGPNMDKMRADMGGAACIVGAIYTLSQLGVPAHIHAFIPLCENMPGACATKPGDVVTAMNGKTIQIDNTDAEGRLILADALCYASSHQPTGVLDMATLTGAIGVALGSSAAGLYTKSPTLWTKLKKAGGRTGDRLWRMPLWDHYTKQMNDSQLADLNNVAGRPGGSCTAAAFLKEFCEHPEWAHLDIAGVMENKPDEISYMGKGMSGRPTRTIVEFFRKFDVKEES